MEENKLETKPAETVQQNKEPKPATGESSKTLKVLVVGLLVAIAALGGAYYYSIMPQGTNQDTANPPPPIGEHVLPPPPPAATPETVDAWITVNWLPKLLLVENDDCGASPWDDQQQVYCGSFRNYEAGTVTSGQHNTKKIYLSAEQSMGTVYSHYVFEGDKKIYFTEKTGIRGINDVPDAIAFPGNPSYQLKEGYVAQSLFDELTLVKKLFTDPKLGDFYLASDGCIVVELPNHTALSFDFNPAFINNENGMVDVEINSVKNTDSYDFRRPTCLANCYYWAIVRDEDLNPQVRLKVIGKTPNGENIFGISDPNDSKLQEIYNDKNTVAYAVDNGWPDQTKSKYTYEQFLALNPLFYWQDPIGRWIEFRNRKVAIAAEMCKPVIYLYPETISKVNVQVFPNLGFTYTDPQYQENGWDVLAFPNGQLINLANGKPYDYLFWEGRATSYPNQEEGFVVKSSELKQFFDDALPKLGLKGQEIADFEEYWVNRLTARPYYKLSFVHQATFDELAPLKVSGDPDTIIRVMLTAEGLDEYKEIPQQKFGRTPLRNGFSVVEWGGVVLE